MRIQRLLSLPSIFTCATADSDSNVHRAVITPDNIGLLAKLNTIYPNLEELIIMRTDIKSIPSSLMRLDKLESLALIDNYSIKTFANIAYLKNLKILTIQDCDLCLIPNEVLKLEKLEELDISRNSIMSLPSKLSRLANLRTLKCERNWISFIPKSFQDLTLVHLDLRTNPIEQKDFGDNYGSESIIKLFGGLVDEVSDFYTIKPIAAADVKAKMEELPFKWNVPNLREIYHLFSPKNILERKDIIQFVNSDRRFDLFSDEENLSKFRAFLNTIYTEPNGIQELDNIKFHIDETLGKLFGGQRPFFDYTSQTLFTSNFVERIPPENQILDFPIPCLKKDYFTILENSSHSILIKTFVFRIIANAIEEAFDEILQIDGKYPDWQVICMWRYKFSDQICIPFNGKLEAVSIDTKFEGRYGNFLDAYFTTLTVQKVCRRCFDSLNQHIENVGIIDLFKEMIRDFCIEQGKKELILFNDYDADHDTILNVCLQYIEIFLLKERIIEKNNGFCSDSSQESNLAGARKPSSFESILRMTMQWISRLFS